MKRVWLSLALLATAVLALAASGGATTSQATSRSGAAGAGAGKDGTPAGHVKLLPKFVQKQEQERLAAADLVARGKATADAEGVVTLKNGKRVQYRQEGEEY